jgi:hypothetical protein
MTWTTGENGTFPTGGSKSTAGLPLDGSIREIPCLCPASGWLRREAGTKFPQSPAGLEAEGTAMSTSDPVTVTSKVHSFGYGKMDTAERGGDYLGEVRLGMDDNACI